MRLYGVIIYNCLCRADLIGIIVLLLSIILTKLWKSSLYSSMGFLSLMQNLVESLMKVAESTAGYMASYFC